MAIIQHFFLNNKGKPLSPEQSDGCSILENSLFQLKEAERFLSVFIANDEMSKSKIYNQFIKKNTGKDKFHYF